MEKEKNLEKAINGFKEMMCGFGWNVDEQEKADMNIDKDIEILKNLIKYLQNKIDIGENKIIYDDNLYDEKIVDCINAIENVLEDREIWKKMSEKLAEELYINKLNSCCIKCENSSCETSMPKSKECFLDWARNEVKNDK